MLYLHPLEEKENSKNGLGSQQSYQDSIAYLLNKSPALPLYKPVRDYCKNPVFILVETEN
jgi:hypothetical protein